MKAAPKKNQLMEDSEDQSDGSGFDEEEKAIFKMLPTD